MRKSNNKGFSLIEVIISVAVLTILIVPIVMQLTKALETNANAKERQAAVENADEVLEYFQKTDKEVLDMGGTGEINPTAGSSTDFTTVDVKEDVDCALYSTSGGKVTDIQYKATNYVAGDVKLGRKKNEYARTIIVDDLNNKVMSEGYRISTTADISDDLKNNPAASGLNWVKTNEGNVVAYDSDNHVCAAVVEEKTDEEKDIGYVDPNEMNLGYVQNLDSETMAIIPTDVFQLDDMFNNDIYNTVLEAVIAQRASSGTDKISDEDWDSMMEMRYDPTTGYEGTALDYAIRRAHVEKERLISINVSHNGAGEDDYYTVTVDVFYNAELKQLLVGNVNLNLDGKKVSYHYPVYTKDFSMKQPPDIYMVYKPLVSTFVDETYYVTDEYIVTSADYDCLKDREKMSKLYLVKPGSVSLTGRKYDSGVSCVDEDKGMFISYSFDLGHSAEGFLEAVNEKYVPTKLHIYSMESKDGSETAEPMEIYTNIATKSEDDKKKQYTITEKANISSDLPVAIQEDSGFKNIFEKYSKQWSDMDYKYIKSLSDGDRKLARLYTVRVALENKKTGDKIYITGAKGAD